MKTTKNLVVKKLDCGQYGNVAIREWRGEYYCEAFVTDSEGNVIDAWYDVAEAMSINGESVGFVTESGAEDWFAKHGLKVADNIN